MAEVFMHIFDCVVVFWGFLMNNYIGSFIVSIVIFGTAAVIVRNIISD